MPRKKSNLSQVTKAAKRTRLNRMNETPEVRAQNLKKRAEANRLRRSKETPAQRASRLEADLLRIHKKRYDIKKIEILKQKRKDEITQIEDAERHLAYGKKKFAELKKKLSELRCNSINIVLSKDNAKAGKEDLCVVKIECGE